MIKTIWTLLYGLYALFGWILPIGFSNDGHHNLSVLFGIIWFFCFIGLLRFISKIPFSF